MNATTEENTAIEKIEESSPLLRTLDLVIPVATLEADIDKQLLKIGKKAKMQGFRPGKIPADLLKQQYGGQAYSDAIEELVQNAWVSAVNEAKYRVAGYPKIEPKKNENEDKTNLVFVASFEIYPEIVLSDVKNIDLEKPVLNVGDAELEKTINTLQKQRVHFEEAQKSAANGDKVTVDFLGKKDGVAFDGGTSTNYPFVLGEGRMLPDFEAAAIGLSAGESKSFDMTFPADYGAKDLAGQAVVFEIKVNKVEAPVLPEINAEFAKSLGVKDGDVAKMRAEIETNLKREVKSRLNSRVKNQVMDALLTANKIDVPKALIDMEIEALMKDAQENMAQRMGAQGQKMPKDFPMQREWFVDQAARRVTLGLLLADIIRTHELKASAEQIRQAVEEMAQSYEKPEDVVRWYYSDKQRLADVEGMVVEDNVVEWVLANAKTTEKSVDFDELMGR